MKTPSLQEQLEALSLEKFTRLSPVAMTACCRDLDGTLKATLTRHQGPCGCCYQWRVWTSSHPLTEEPFSNDERTARKTFSAACLHGTNGRGE